MRLDIENPGGNFNFFEDRLCVTQLEAGHAMLATGLAQDLAFVFSGGINDRGGDQNLTNAAGERCMNAFQLGQDFGTAGEHNLDTGFIDPLPDPDQFFRTIASFIATGEAGNLEAGRQATEEGGFIITFDDFLALKPVFEVSQQCQVDRGTDGQTQPGFDFTIERIMKMAGGGVAEVELKTFFELFYKGKFDPARIVPSSVPL